MNRDKFAHSRMCIESQDGSAVGTCSVHCTAVELALGIDETLVAISAGDYNTTKLIDAEDASWVLGGSKPGVMTPRAKWAFAARGDAEAFIASQWGSVAAFDDATKAAYEDMYQGTTTIREKKKMKGENVMMMMMKQQQQGTPLAPGRLGKPNAGGGSCPFDHCSYVRRFISKQPVSPRPR